MEITSNQYKHCDLIKVKGRIDSSTAPQLNQVLNTRLEDGRYKFVLDLSELEFISSAGLRVLISIQKSCKRYNRGEIILAHVPSNIFSALDLAGFTSFFKLSPDVIAAVAGF
jgi:anti-sigma B factor antagonist